jgi:hypothetical protein
MTDTNFDTRSNTTDPSVKEHLAKAGSDVKQRASDAFEASADVTREKIGEATELAKSVASETFDRVQDQAKTKQHVGADFLDKFAGNLREAAKSFDNDAPIAASGIKAAAQYVDGAAEKLRNGSLQDLVNGATDFAKRQPAAFLGLSVLAGFAAVRFLKASSGAVSSTGDEARHD